MFHLAAFVFSKHIMYFVEITVSTFLYSVVVILWIPLAKDEHISIGRCISSIPSNHLSGKIFSIHYLFQILLPVPFIWPYIWPFCTYYMQDLSNFVNYLVSMEGMRTYMCLVWVKPVYMTLHAHGARDRPDIIWGGRGAGDDNIHCTTISGNIQL